MTPTKGDVKHWLKAIGKNRDWLAMECGTEKGTVNNWLSPSGPFPASAMLKIQSLMSQYKTVQPEKTNREASNAAVHFRKQAPQEKAFRTPWARAGLRFYGTGRLGSLQSGIIHLNSQPEHADSHQAENAGSGDGKNVHCQLPPLRLFPASTNQRPQRAADGTGANAPLFFPGGLSSGIQVGPHHHGMRKWLRLHYGKV